MNPVKQLTKKVLASAGLELKKIQHGNSEEACATRLLRKTSPDLVIDVGANEGQYAERMLQMARGIRIVSFEPLSSAHRKLTQAARKYPRWQVAERCAIGSASGSIEINISQNSQSSSILPMQPALLDAAPETAYVAQESVPIKRLDAVIQQYLRSGETAYLKVDTQGYEEQVLLGAEGLLPSLSGIQLELSLVELYQGERLAFDMIEFVESLGFHLFALSNGFCDAASGQLLQIDGFFIAKSIAGAQGG
jgi:FkbM family methyltransferase